jgi:hypothetical protein
MVRPQTERMWSKQDQHQGDRWRLYTAVSAELEARQVLYPGSFVDIAPSFVWSSVTYVDSNDRARRFFADKDGVQEIIAHHEPPTATPEVVFVAGDYTGDLGLSDESYDLLISLYAGFVSEHCSRYLRVGGTLLVNSSHGDAAMASIDDRFNLSAVITSSDRNYRISSEELDQYLVPKKADVEITVEMLHQLNRGVAYTRSPFAYIFERVA